MQNVDEGAEIKLEGGWTLYLNYRDEDNCKGAYSKDHLNNEELMNQTISDDKTGFVIKSKSK